MRDGTSTLKRIFLISSILETEKHKSFMAVKNPHSDTRHGRCHNFSIIPYQKICGTSVSPPAISSVASGTRQGTSGIKKPSVVAGMATFVSYKVTYLNCLF